MDANVSDSRCSDIVLALSKSNHKGVLAECADKQLHGQRKAWDGVNEAISLSIADQWIFHFSDFSLHVCYYLDYLIVPIVVVRACLPPTRPTPDFH